ncbi:unnamed protein product [Owenia fusiformis]|uniref:Uncharacterized protein n=1 Tax=Owenia fusiformis TaxID=6347 RepID=A0A8J1UD24_OWEFU|nr:unnamed protein product [Owenia fusiformis]
MSLAYSYLIGLVIYMGYFICCDNVAVKPSDIIAKSGEDAEMPCQLADEEITQSEIVSWYDFTKREDGLQIFNSYEPDTILSPKFAVNTKAAKYNLKIKNISIEDAGKYMCKTFYGQSQYSAYVTVYGTPSCVFDSVIEGESVTVMCNMRYAGYAKPTLKWLRDGEEERENVSYANKDDHYASAKFTFDISSVKNRTKFTCQVNSKEPEYVDQCILTWNSLNEGKSESSHIATGLNLRDVIAIAILAPLMLLMCAIGVAVLFSIIKRCKKQDSSKGNIRYSAVEHKPVNQ